MLLTRRDALALSLVAFSQRVIAAEPQTLRIGVQLPITGERSSVGRLMQNGLQMALETINGRDPPQGIKLELIWADDESTPEGAVRILDKLAADPQVIAVAGEINSPFVMAGVPIIDKAGLPYLTGGSSPRTTVASPWIFRVGANDTLLAGFLTRYLVEDLKLKSIALLHDKTGIHNQRAELVTNVLKEKYQIVPLVNASWSPGDRTFAAQLEQVKASHAEAILALGETPEGGSFLKQVKASGVQAQVVAQRDFGVKRVLDEAGKAAEDTVILTEYASDLQGEATQKWNGAYRRQYGVDSNIISAQYYDALMLLAEAAKTPGPTRAGVKSGLEHMKNFPGVVTDYMFDAGRNGVHRFYVSRVTDGRLSLIKTLSEELRDPV
jgi:branched-chain amino acid transport system substrate-binding protein